MPTSIERFTPERGIRKPKLIRVPQEPEIETEDELTMQFRKLTEMPGVQRRLTELGEVFFTPDFLRDAGLEMGIGEGSQLRVELGDEGYRFSEIPPAEKIPPTRVELPETMTTEGWQVTDEGFLKSPANELFTPEELEQKRQTDLREFEQTILPQLPQDIRAQYANIPIEDFVLQVQEYFAPLEERRANLNRAFFDVFPEYEQLGEGIVDTWLTNIETDDKFQSDFVTMLQQRGRTSETENLLKALGASEATVQEFFAEAQAVGAETVLQPEPEWENVKTGEVITKSELDKRYPKGYEGELNQWRLTTETGRNYWHVFKIFGESLTKLPRQLAASILSATQGYWGASAVNKDWADNLISEANEDINAFANDVTEKYSGIRLPIPLGDLATLPQSMSFSLTSMGAGLAVGVPIALIPEPTPLSRIAAWTAGTAASGAVAFNMSSYQIMQIYLEAKNEEMKATLGREITLQEEGQLKQDFSNLAIKYGLWEAVPEAISNLAFAKILTAPLGRMVGKSIAVRIIAKLASLYGEEFLTETITQKGQSDIEVQAGLREGKISWVEAFKEIAPQTFLLTTILGGVGQIGVSSVNRIKQSLKQEASDNPVYEDIKDNITDKVFDEVEAAGIMAEKPLVARETAVTAPVPGQPMGKIVNETTMVRTGEPAFLVEWPDGSRTSVEKSQIGRYNIEKLPTPEPSMPELGLQPPNEAIGKIPTVPEQPAVPPPQGDAVRLVHDRIQFEPEQEGFTDKIRRGWHKFNVKMVDDLFAIKKLTDQLKKQGVELSIDENPYLLARLQRGITGKTNTFLETGTFGKQFWKVEKGKAKPNFTGESLENILKEAKDPEVWRDFSTYLVAKRAFELSMRDIKTGISQAESAAALAALEAKYSNFPGLADRIYQYQDRLLVYSREMGLISEDMLTKLRKYGSYVPFYRVFNELQAKGLMGKKMANIAQPIKKIKGSEREIINPLESIVKNTYVLMDAAERNQVGIMLANLADKFPQVTEVFERVKTPIARVAGITAKELGVEIEGMTDADAEAVIDIFRPSFFTKGDEVTVLIDGKKKYFKVDADLREALLHLDRESIGMLGRILGAPARWLRAGATLSPDFMVRNPARDQMTAFAYSNYGFIPGIDFLRGLASIISKDADYHLFRQSGAEHSMLVSMDRDYLQKTWKELMSGRDALTYVKHPMELLRIISELGEKGTRLGEFKAGIRRGATPLEAGYSARAVTLDFSQMGTTAKAINTMIAFWNANIRGWGRMLSSFKEHPGRTSAKVFMGITLPSILLYLANRDDDRWKEIPQWQKDLFWIILTPDNIYRIPKPFELGIIFGSLPERFMEWLDNKDPELFKDALLNLAEAGNPGYIPTIAEPIIEWMTNYSFFRGGPIVPASRGKMPPELQYTRYTSEVSKKLGELLQLSPAKLDNLLSGYTAGLGSYLIDSLDIILKRTGISPDIPQPSPTLADLPVTKAFVVRNPYGSSGQTIETFYNTLEKYEQGEQYLKEMLKLNEEQKFEDYKAKHPELLFFYQFPDGPEKEGVFYSASARFLRRVARDMSELSKKQDEIFKDKNMSPDEKRRLIDEIDILKTETAQKALDLLLGKEPMVLQDAINAEVNRLGELIDNVPLLSLENPDIYTTRTLHGKLANILEAIKPDELAQLTDIDSRATSYLQVKEVENTMAHMPNKKIYEIKPDLREGVTFEQYYQSWKDGIAKNETFDTLSRRQLELLREYNRLDDEQKKQFVEDNPELSLNPQRDWLVSNPKENALLAIWGQAKILTKEAYNEFKRLVEELDIPDDGLPPQTLPPEASIDNYFSYLDLLQERSANSWEVQLLLLDDNGLLEFLGRNPIDIPRQALELLVKNRETWDEYKLVEDKRQFRIGNAEFAADIRRIEAYQNKADDNVAELWVEHGRIADRVTGFNAEEKVWLTDNPEVYRWALDNELLTDDGLKWNVPALRIDVKWAEQDTEYNALPTTSRTDYLEANEDYRKDRRRREAYQKGFADELVEPFVEYWELPVTGYRRERMLKENPKLAEDMGVQVPDKVPSEKYDDLLEKPDKTERDLVMMEGYKSFVQDNFVNRYADWIMLIREGTPADWPEGEIWYEDDWYLQEHPAFYADIYLDHFGLKERDFSNVPTREVWAKYVAYLSLDSVAKDDFRWDNKDLDKWLADVKGFTPIAEKRRRTTLTPKERAEQEARGAEKGIQKPK